MTQPTRRALLAGLAAAALPGRAALAQAPARYSSVVVDVRPLLAEGLDGFAEAMRAAAQAQASASFADRLGSGPLLALRFDRLHLNASASGPGGGGGSGRRGGGSGTDVDYLDGEALVVGSRGEVLARHPQLVTHPSNSGGAWFDPAFNLRRAEAISRAYVQWMRRKLG